MYNSSDIFEQFFTVSNPLFYGFLLTILILIIGLVLLFKVALPLHKRYILKEQKHLLEKAQIMALFSEMDPDPLFRINLQGKILHYNKAAKELLKSMQIEAGRIMDLIPGLTLAQDFQTHNFLRQIGTSKYIVHVVPYDNKEFVNIYLRDVTKLKDYEASLEEYKDRLKLMGEKLDNENDELKRLISYELHDDICQKLVALKYQSAAPDSSGLGNNIDLIYNRVRDLSRELKPANIEFAGLRISLQVLVDNIIKQSGIKGVFGYSGQDQKLSPLLENEIFRICQEALSNITHHSNAAEFSVELDIKDNTLSLLVADDGDGIPPEYFEHKNYKNYGIGLYNIKERVERYGGIFKITSNKESGTILDVKIPLKETENETH